MKLLTGWVMSAGLVLTAAAANAQAPAPHETGDPSYRVVSDIDGPYAAMPPDAPVPPRYGPALLPPPEVYTVLRENGFSPLGIPHQRGLVYTIAVVDRRGDDGRLVIDARNGRIIRFMPAYRMGDNGDMPGSYGPGGPLPPASAVRGPPRPPLSIPRVASRMPAAVPVPRAAPPRAGEVPRAGDVKPLAATPPAPVPAPAQQSAAVQPKPAETPPAPQAVAPQAAAPTVEAKPATPQIEPTQEMPKVQGLE
jgi:hypothetical protein